MENNKILSAAFLDILFDGRNKDYGAYDLRKSYNKRIATALVATGSLLLLLFLGSVLAHALNKDEMSEKPIEQIITLSEVKPAKAPDPIVIPPPQKLLAPPPVKMENFTPPIVTPDEQVKPDEVPPVNETLITAQIGTDRHDGTDDPGIVAPLTEPSTGLAVAPIQDTEDYDQIFVRVEEPATFKGGTDGWRRYLERNLVYPDVAVENGNQAVVKVQLVVDKNGKIAEVQALNDPGDGLAEEAMRVIRKGPDWIPAEQNGRKVSFRFVQSITFSLGN